MELLTAMSTGRRSATQSLSQCMDLSMPANEAAMAPNGPYKLLNQPTRGSFAVNTTVIKKMIWSNVYFLKENTS